MRQDEGTPLKRRMLITCANELLNANLLGCIPTAGAQLFNHALVRKCYDFVLTGQTTEPGTSLEFSEQLLVSKHLGKQHKMVSLATFFCIG